MTTPMRRQYLAVKSRFPDTIVFFRLGDFYETFDDDARLVAQVCDIVLTSRPVGKDVRVPLAGVPYHAVESYLARLLQAGHKVAIVEQIGDVPATGLVEREVVRVVTPGTVVEPALLDERRNNYLASVVMEGRRVGLAYADITTGEFAATQLEGDEVGRLLVEELDRLRPAEVVTGQADALAQPRDEPAPWTVTPAASWTFELETAGEALRDHFEVASLDGFGLAGLPLAVRAAGGLVHYLADTQRARLAQLSSLRTYSVEQFMTLDPATRRNLELTESLRRGTVQGSLLGVLDKTVTGLGSRLLRRWLHQPLLRLEELDARLDAVQLFCSDTPARLRLRTLLKGVADLERLTSRAVQGIAGPRDLLAMRRSLDVLPGVSEVLASLAAGGSGGSVTDSRPAEAGGGSVTDSCPAEAGGGSVTDSCPAGEAGGGSITDARPAGEAGEGSVTDPRPGVGLAAEALARRLPRDMCADVVQLIAQAVADDPPATINAPGAIRPGFSAELDNIGLASRDAKEWVANLERSERERTGIRNLKVGYNKVFGYYLEITQANADRVPADYIRKQTLVNAERYITPELKEYEALILNAQERILELQKRIYQQVLEQIAAAAGRLLAAAQALAHLDVYAALAEVAVLHRFVRPALTADDELHIVAGRHPVVEVSQRDEPFVPNDTHLSEAERILVITGPNMSGKSTYLRQVALIVLMAQVGSFVPADEARIGLVDRIFTRIGAQDEISAGQSTFMVEMVETANLLNHATRRSLLVLDEVGRGTSTYDGISIAWAVVEHIHNHPRLRCKTLFATHYHELTQLAELLPAVCNYNVAVAEERDKVVFLRRIVPGGADRSYGIHVAQLAGLPRPVIHRAQEILEELEEEARAPGALGLVARAAALREVRQLPLFAIGDPVGEELERLDISAMTPLEAINTLYALQNKARSR